MKLSITNNRNWVSLGELSNLPIIEFSLLTKKYVRQNPTLTVETNFWCLNIMSNYYFIFYRLVEECLRLSGEQNEGVFNMLFNSEKLKAVQFQILSKKGDLTC